MRGPERSSYVAPTVTNNVEWLFQRTRGSIGPKLGEHPVSHFAENFDYFRALKDRQDTFKKAPKRRTNVCIIAGKVGPSAPSDRNVGTKPEKWGRSHFSGLVF